MGRRNTFHGICELVVAKTLTFFGYGPFVAPGGHLNSDFQAHIWDDMVNDVPVRCVRILCVGVATKDVRVQPIANGCVVTLVREGAPGLSMTTWVRRFQFWRLMNTSS